MSENEYLEAIKGAPHSIELRSRLAAFLDSKGDERGELIRLEDEAAALSVSDERYWASKTRRTELRRLCSQDFLSALGYTSVYKPVFANALWGDSKSRWRAIREWTSRWYAIELNDVGRVPDDARILAASLRRELSPSLVEWMAFTEDILQTPAQQMLRDGRCIEDFEEHQSISLNLQAEGDYHWALRYDELRKDDPPVDHYLLDYDDDTFSQEGLGSPSVSDFALSYLSSYLYGRRGFGIPVDEHFDHLLKALPNEIASLKKIGSFWILEDEGMFGIIDEAGTVFDDTKMLRLKFQSSDFVVSSPTLNKLLEGEIAYSFTSRSS